MNDGPATLRPHPRRHPGSCTRVAHRQGPAHRRGQDPPPAREHRQAGQPDRAGLRVDDRRGAARPHRGVPEAVRRRRGPRLPDAGGVRHGARGGQAGARPASVRRAGDGWRRAAPRQHRRDEDRRGQDAGGDPPVVPQRADRQGRPRRHGQRLPGQVPRRVDGPHPPLPGPDDGRHPARDDAGGASRRLRVRHHLRHEQRARLRLPARQHGQLPRGPGPAAAELRHRRRGRLDPDRRGPDPADHQRPHAGRGRVVRRVRQGRRPADQGRGLRGRREEEDDLDPRSRHHQGRGLPRHREPLRVGQHAADLLPQQLDQGQGALPQRQGVRRHRRRGAHRRRAHRPHPLRPPLQRRPPPGDRGQGGRDRPRGVPDPRHDHPAELLPPLRQARRHDRHGDDRGLGVRQDLQARRRPDPDQQADDPDRPARPGLPHRGGEVRRGGQGHRRAQPHRPAGAGRHDVGGEVRAALRSAEEAGRPAHGAQRQDARRRGQGGRARGPQGRGHGGHQHGRSRHRHHARRLDGVPRRPGAAHARPRPGRGRRGVQRRLAVDAGAHLGAGRGRGRTRSPSSVASTSSAPSATSRGASTTSCVVVPAARATRGSPASTSRWATT